MSDKKIVQVQQIPFSWDLTMSQKIDATGTCIGSYELGDLHDFWFPKEYKKGRRRQRLRILNYDLVWDITEMQVKVHVRALFPNPTGSLPTQLAKERLFEANERTYAGESRSRALERDIEMSRAAISRPDAEALFPHQGGETQEASTDVRGPARNKLVDDPVMQHPQQNGGPAERPQTTSPARIILHLGTRNMNSSMNASRLRTPW
jgi:hypothetical protein